VFHKIVCVCQEGKIIWVKTTRIEQCWTVPETFFVLEWVLFRCFVILIFYSMVISEPYPAVVVIIP